jgi:hypothetical protein
MLDAPNLDARNANGGSDAGNRSSEATDYHATERPVHRRLHPFDGNPQVGIERDLHFGDSVVSLTAMWIAVNGPAHSRHTLESVRVEFPSRFDNPALVGLALVAIADSMGVHDEGILEIDSQGPLDVHSLSPADAMNLQRRSGAVSELIEDFTFAGGQVLFEWEQACVENGLPLATIIWTRNTEGVDLERLELLARSVIVRLGTAEVAGHAAIIGDEIDQLVHRHSQGDPGIDDEI